MKLKTMTPWMICLVIMVLSIETRAISPSPSYVLLQSGLVISSPSSPAYTTIQNDMAVSNFTVNPSNFTINGTIFGIQQSQTIIPFYDTLVIWNPQTNIGNAFVWVGYVPIGSIVYFYFPNMGLNQYSFIVDNATQDVQSGPSMTFNYAIPGNHYFVLEVTTSPTLDTVALTLIIYLIAILILTGMAFFIHPGILIMDGILTLAFAFWIYTQISNLIISSSLILVAAMFIIAGATMHPKRKAIGQKVTR